MNEVFIDTETLGLTGPMVLLQYGTTKSDIKIHHVWKRPVQETLDVIKGLLRYDTWVLFNAKYDSFHIAKIYNLFSLVADKTQLPDEEEIRVLETGSYQANLCIKPKHCIDIMVLLKRHLLQFVMVRKDRPYLIRRVPKQAVSFLEPKLREFSDSLNPLLFAYSPTADPWKIDISTDKNGKEIPGFVDIKLMFHPSAALKTIMKYLFGKIVQGIEIPPQYMPTDESHGTSSKEYRPYNFTWPQVLDYHIAYWESKQGMQYAREDIEHLITLKDYIVERDHTCVCGKKITPSIRCESCHELNVINWPLKHDEDSDLAWMIGQVRHRGFGIDNKLLEETLRNAKQSQDIVPTSRRQVLAYLRQSVDWRPEYDLLINNTDARTLEEIERNDWGDVSARASKVIAERSLQKQIDVLEKLYEVGRIHPDFNVSGTKSNRMSGTGGLNFQGIEKGSDVRKIFTFTDRPEDVLSGGDFEGQEPTILDALVDDPLLRQDFEEYRSLYLLMWRILKNKPDGSLIEFKKDKETYAKIKAGVLAWSYGCEDPKFAETVDCSIEKAQKTRAAWNERYKKFGDRVARITKQFVSMEQANGLGTMITYREPKQYAESMFGYRRYFILENSWVKFLVTLAMRIPPFEGSDTQVMRRDRMQTVRGALSSSLYGAAFGMQAANLRQAGNHEIQSTGAGVTKRVQWEIWQLQPVGIASFVVRPYNVHDEVLCVNNCPEKVATVVYDTVNKLREKIPLLAIDWKDRIANWSER